MTCCTLLKERIVADVAGQATITMWIDNSKPNIAIYRSYTSLKAGTWLDSCTELRCIDDTQPLVFGII